MLNVTGRIIDVDGFVENIGELYSCLASWIAPDVIGAFITGISWNVAAGTE